MSDSPPEETLARSFAEIEANRLGNALQLTEALLVTPELPAGQPDQGRPAARQGAADPDLRRPQPTPRPTRWPTCARRRVARLKAYRDRPPSQLRAALPAADGAGAELRHRRRHPAGAPLHLPERRTGRPRFVADYYVSHGKLGADKCRRGRQAHPGRRLSRDRQPARARSCPTFTATAPSRINYPNEWDKPPGPRRPRHLAARHPIRHLSPARPRASDGCVVLTNQDLDARRQEPAGRPDTGHHQPVGRVAVTRRLGRRTQRPEQDHRKLAGRLGEPRHRPLPEPITPSASRPATRIFEEFASQKKQVNASKELDQDQGQQPVRVP